MKRYNVRRIYNLRPLSASKIKLILALAVTFSVCILVLQYNSVEKPPPKIIRNGDKYIFPSRATNSTRNWPTFEPPSRSNGRILKRSVFNRAQKCLLDSPYAPEDVHSYPVVNSYDYELPSDVEQHYFDLLNYTMPMRRIKISSYSDYNGPWMEDVFIATFCCDKPLSYFGGYIPLFVQWTDLFHVDQDKNYTPTWYRQDYSSKFFSMLRKDVVYLAVVQHQGGIFLDKGNFHPRDHWNILVLSGGGNGHVPVPLLLKELPYHADLMYKPRENVFVFAGTIWSIYHVRKQMAQTLREMSAELKFNYQIYHGAHWRAAMINGSLNLAPRGFGRTSFRLAECIQMGLIPVYLYDDHDWTPYRGSPAHVSSLGFSMHISEFRDFVNKTVRGLQRDPDYLKIPERTIRMKRFRESHYTMKGLMEQIRYLFHGDSRSNLVCQLYPALKEE